MVSPKRLLGPCNTCSGVRILLGGYSLLLGCDAYCQARMLAGTVVIDVKERRLPFGCASKGFSVRFRLAVKSGRLPELAVRMQARL